MTVSVFIADDHPVVLGGLQSLVEQHEEFCVIGTATDGRIALDNIVRLQPELVILDFKMPSANGLEVLEALRARNLAARVVVLAASATDHEIYAIVSAGVDGLLFKDAAATTLRDCLDSVARGGKWISPQIMALVAKEERHLSTIRAEFSLLTPREQDLVKLVATGCSNKQIAHTLQVTEGTVKVHLNNIFRKLNLSSRAELAEFDIKTDRR